MSNEFRKNDPKLTIKERGSLIMNTANRLMLEIDRKTYVSVGRGAEERFGVSWMILLSAVRLLTSDGYRTWMVRDDDGKFRKIIAPDCVLMKDVWENAVNVEHP